MHHVAHNKGYDDKCGAGFEIYDVTLLDMKIDY
jgi:hypothetical protein